MQSMSCACVLSDSVYLVVINDEVIVKKKCLSVRACTGVRAHMLKPVTLRDFSWSSWSQAASETVTFDSSIMSSSACEVTPSVR
jgi:hypothetical protein